MMSEACNPWVLLPPRGPNDLNMAEVVVNAADYAAHRDLAPERQTLLVRLTALVAERVEEKLHDDEFARVRVQVMRAPCASVDCIPGGLEPVAAISCNCRRVGVSEFEKCSDELVDKLAEGIVEILRSYLTDDVEHLIYMPYILLVMHSAVLGEYEPYIPFVTRFGTFILRKAS